MKSLNQSHRHVKQQTLKQLGTPAFLGNCKWEDYCGMGRQMCISFNVTGIGHGDADLSTDHTRLAGKSKSFTSFPYVKGFQKASACKAEEDF